MIEPGDRGAGTPDREADYKRHQEVDIAPYNWCCNDCDEMEYCDNISASEWGMSHIATAHIN